jgi:hypothetical protein
MEKGKEGVRRPLSQRAVVMDSYKEDACATVRHVLETSGPG